jgi:hypothetical protein
MLVDQHPNVRRRHQRGGHHGRPINAQDATSARRHVSFACLLKRDPRLCNGRWPGD